MKHNARLSDGDWLEKKHNGYCRHINRNQWGEIEAHIWRTVFWRRQKGHQAYSPHPPTDRLSKRLLEVYKTTGRLFEIDRMAEANNKRKDNARNAKPVMVKNPPRRKRCSPVLILRRAARPQTLIEKWFWRQIGKLYERCEGKKVRKESAKRLRRY